MKIIYFFLFAFIWLAISGLGEGSLPPIFAFIASLLVILLSWLLSDGQSNILAKKYPFNRTAIIYFFWLLKEIFNSSLAVSKLAWRRNIYLQPILKPIKTQQKELLGTIIYANSITLTPGTVTLSQEGEYLLVHALDISFMHDLETNVMTRKISKIIRPTDQPKNLSS